MADRETGLKTAILIDELTPGESKTILQARALQRVNIRFQFNVRIEQQNQLRIELRDTLIYSTGETAVSRIPDKLHGSSSLHKLAGIILGRVIDYNNRPIEAGIQASFNNVARVVSDNHDAGSSHVKA